MLLDLTDFLNHKKFHLKSALQVVKSRRMRWAGHVARMGGRERGAEGSGGET